MDPASYRISEKAVQRVAEAAVLTVPGTRAIDAKLAGLAGRSFPRVDAHIDRPAGSVALDVEIVTTYPAPVGAITDEVRETVGTHVETLTGLAVTRVNIAVADAEATEGLRVTRSDLVRHPVGVVPTPIEIAPSTVTSPVVKEQVRLRPIEVDDSTYDNIVSVDTPPAPRVVHVSVPPTPTVRGVSAPAPMRLSPVFKAPQTPLAPVTAPHPAPVRTPVVPAPAPLLSIHVTPFAQQRAVDIPPAAPLKPVTVNQFAPRKPVEIPPAEPLRAITVNAPERLAPVSLPARKPLDPIYAPRPKYVAVTRPDPQPLRRVGVEKRADVLVPQAPQPQPLDPITVIPEEEIDD